MGCYLYNYGIESEINYKDEKVNKYYQAYLSLKDMIIWIKKTNLGAINAYLISRKSIQNFIDIIVKSNILNKLSENDLLENAEKDLKKSLEEYNLDQNIVFLSNPQECLKYQLEKNSCENEFIIVDTKFIKQMGLDYINSINKQVEIIVDNKKSIYRIKFHNHKRILYFKEKKLGIFCFCQKEIINNDFLISLKLPKNFANNFFVPRTLISDDFKGNYDYLSYKIDDWTDSNNITEIIRNKKNLNNNIDNSDNNF